ncbi:hypothetical protein [Nitrosomonas sp.]|uniref:hypothetical protein n=1 Tax=Nitrosomonas sp. TaxID=42353 RepID=UPI00258BFE03|nr:hypothetical protein [Nitrosomonas sp.]
MTNEVSSQEGTAQATEASHHGADRLPESVVDAAISWAVRLDYNTPTVAQQQALPVSRKHCSWTMAASSYSTLTVPSVPTWPGSAVSLYCGAGKFSLRPGLIPVLR